MAREKMQMVDDDEIENVGIMSGFLDDIDELMEEIEKEGQVEEGDDADMARILDRRPDSPEILMNNLRGDYRSIDARREELADRVGYNAAQQTPDEVLAMLQPILAQQGIAALPMGGADVGALPMDAMTGMPPPGGMPPPAGMPMDPAMMGAPPAGMPPMDPAMMAQMPPEGIASLPMDQGAMPPMQMARGGIVQHFERGGAAASATDSISPIDEYLAQRPQAAIDPMSRARELTPEYQELLGISDRGATQAQMLFDIAQAALGYASNVGPDGQPLSGSGAARLAGATRALPGQLGARAAAMQDDQTRARLAALQQAQDEREATIASNTALSAEQRAILLAREQQEADMALEMAKSAPSFRPATPEEAAQFNAIAGQIDDRTGRFYPANPPSGMTITSTPDGGLQLTQGPGVGSSRAGGLEYTVENGVTVARPIPGTPAAAEVQAQRGRLESALLTGQDMIGTIESIVGRPAVEGGATAMPADPALDSILGMYQGRIYPTTQAGEDLKVKVDQIAGVAFLQAFESLKGAGAITQDEGRKATEAIARLSRTQSPEAFKASLFEFTDIVRRGMEKARSDLAALPRLDSPAPTVLRFDEQGNPLQ
jgi:hypothetical protein